MKGLPSRLDLYTDSYSGGLNLSVESAEFMRYNINKSVPDEAKQAQPWDRMGPEAGPRSGNPVPCSGKG